MPYLGVSCDGYVSCDYCGEGVIEAKCPYRWGQDTSSGYQQWLEDKRGHLESLTSLKRSRAYFTQVFQYFTCIYLHTSNKSATFCYDDCIAFDRSKCRCLLPNGYMQTSSLGLLRPAWYSEYKEMRTSSVVPLMWCKHFGHNTYSTNFRSWKLHRSVVEFPISVKMATNKSLWLRVTYLFIPTHLYQFMLKHIMAIPFSINID